MGFRFRLAGPVIRRSQIPLRPEKNPHRFAKARTASRLQETSRSQVGQRENSAKADEGSCALVLPSSPARRGRRGAGATERLQLSKRDKLVEPASDGC